MPSPARIDPPDDDLLARLLPGQIKGEPDAPAVVDALVAETIRRGASDLHLLPDQSGLSVQWRVDGVLGPAERLPTRLSANVIARFKVLARLLTYESQTPQEGQFCAGEGGLSPFRISTFPTLFGEKIVARRLTSGGDELATLGDLGLPTQAAEILSRAIDMTSGAVLLVGPAGSGKTTTGYAVLREIARRSAGRRSLASLEDPIEVVLPGVAQSQVAPHAGFELRDGLRALVRQDPEVIFVGEIRDAATAQIAYQAALTGQLVITTFHAADAATALTRLLDMGIPPYMVRSGTRAIVAQRLLRQACQCSQDGDRDSCKQCEGSGYHGRHMVAEAIDLADDAMSTLVRDGVERAALAAAFRERGVEDLRAQAERLIARGVTDRPEVDRVLGST